MNKYRICFADSHPDEPGSGGPDNARQKTSTLTNANQCRPLRRADDWTDVRWTVGWPNNPTGGWSAGRTAGCLDGAIGWLDGRTGIQ